MKMEASDLLNIEFLDLSGVDEKEQIKLRISLQQHNDPNVQLPWKIPRKKHTIPDKGMHNEPAVLPNNVPMVQPFNQNEFITAPMVSPPLTNNIYHTQHPHVVIPPMIQPGYVLPPNMVCYTSPPLPVSYPQPILIPSSAVHTFTPTGHYFPVVTTQQIVTTETVHSDYNLPNQNGTITSPTVVAETPILENIIPTKNDAKDKEKTNDNVDETKSEVMEPIVATQSQPVEQNGLNAVTSPSAGKSWASLFNKSSNLPQQNGFLNNSTNHVEEHVEKARTMDNLVTNNVCPIKYPRKSGQFIDPDCYRMGEFLSTYTIDGKATSLQPRGLLNQSNYCYINSILQAIIACPPLYNLLSGLSQNISSNEKRKPTPVIDGMCRFVKEFKHLPPNQRTQNRRSDGKNPKKDQGVLINTDIPFEPTWIYKMLNGIQTDLIEGRQEDAEEFLGCLLNGLNDEMQELIKLVKNEDDDVNELPLAEETVSNEVIVKGNNSDSDDKEWQVIGAKNKGSVMRRTDFAKTPISDIFGGLLKSKIHRTGDHVTENIQPFFTLQLNIEKVKTVREALEALVSKNQLEGVTSSKTNEEVKAWQQVMLEELPIILVLHLKCFDFKLNGCTKIIKALEFPIDLKIEGKLLSSKTVTPKEKQYKLFAVVYHDGKEASKGHYVTDAFHVGYSSWLRYDDASVKTVQEEQVLKPQGTRVPYLLFYRRCDTIKSK